MIKVVLDTNVIVSAHLKPEGLERAVLNLALAARVEMYISAAIFSEYDLVLHRSKLNIEPTWADASLRLIRSHATKVDPKRPASASPDEADNRFLECAEEAHADYLITGNKRHFPTRWKNTKIVNAREFLELIGSNLKP
jgi:uncharacterized protein